MGKVEQTAWTTIFSCAMIELLRRFVKICIYYLSRTRLYFLLWLQVSFTFKIGTNDSLSALSFERIELVHVGDNMPTLQHNRDSFVGQLNG